MKNKIILLAGRSGVGKTTVADLLESKYGLTSIKSYTTRPKRYEAENNHTFIIDEEFAQIDKDDIVAYTCFNGHKYCATTQQVENNDIYVIDRDGIIYFKEKYKGDKEVVVILLTADASDLIARMKKRGDSDFDIEQRLQNDYDMFDGVETYSDFIINTKNKDTKKTAERIVEIYEA